jgi:hypothetical protein
VEGNDAVRQARTDTTVGTAAEETEPVRWRPGGRLRLWHVLLALACLITVAWLHSHVRQMRLTALVRSWPLPSQAGIRALVVQKRLTAPGEEPVFFVDRPADIAEFYRAALERPAQPLRRDVRYLEGGEVQGLDGSHVGVIRIGWADSPYSFLQVRYEEVPKARVFPLGPRWSQWLQHVYQSYPALHAETVDAPANWRLAETLRRAGRYDLHPSASFVSAATAPTDGAAVRYTWLLFSREPPPTEMGQFRHALAAEVAKTKGDG